MQAKRVEKRGVDVSTPNLKSHHEVAQFSDTDGYKQIGIPTLSHKCCDQITGGAYPRVRPSAEALPYYTCTHFVSNLPNSPVAISLPIDVQLDLVRTVSARNQHLLFLHTSGRVSALGSDAKGQLRGLPSAEGVQAIGCSWKGSYLQTSTGLRSAGANAHGQLGREGADETGLGSVRVPDTARVVDFVCGSEHVLCLLESEGQAEVWGWGWNEHGNLATGSLDDVKVPARIWPPSPAQAGEEVVGVWAGCGTSWIAVSPPAPLLYSG